MIHGIGVDLIDQRRIKPLLENRNDPFFQKIYTDAERRLAETSTDPLRFYAERFAAKEAVFKALGLHGNEIRLNEIETLNSAWGAPKVTLYGALERWRLSMGISDIHISLSNDPPYSVAYVICEIENEHSSEH